MKSAYEIDKYFNQEHTIGRIDDDFHACSIQVAIVLKGHLEWVDDTANNQYQRHENFPVLSQVIFRVENASLSV